MLPCMAETQMMSDSDLVSFVQVGSTADKFLDYFQVSSFGSKHEGSVATLLQEMKPCS